MIYGVFGVLVLSLLIFDCSGQQCKAVYEKKVTEEEQQEIVDKHNELRLLIANGKVPGQPRGVNLKRMKWDDTLALEAQKISNKCVFAHEKVKDDRWKVGQNLYLEGSSRKTGGANWTRAVQRWFDEYVDYDYGTQYNPAAGHYTQVVWADTEYVGCGYTFYKDRSSGWFNKLYTCNYGPAGNYIGQVPYETGDSGCEDLC